MEETIKLPGFPEVKDIPKDNPLSTYEEAEALLYEPKVEVASEHLFDHLHGNYSATMDHLLANVPDGRLKSLAKTSLEESYMWARKALRVNQ